MNIFAHDGHLLYTCYVYQIELIKMTHCWVLVYGYFGHLSYHFHLLVGQFRE